MASEPSSDTPKNSDLFTFATNLARAYGGAILFSFPILMTMEMWWLGFSLPGHRLIIFTLLTVPLLIGLSYFDGFEDTFTGKDDVRETFVAYFVGFTTSAVVLSLFGVIDTQMSADEVVGKISIQAVAASLGAMFAQSLLGGGSEAEEHAEKRKRGASYAGQLFLTAVGAIFLSMSVSPTEEMVLISYKMTEWHAVLLILVTLGVMHAFIFATRKKRETEGSPVAASSLGQLVLSTVPGYAVALLISFYILWTFGSIDDMAFAEKLKATIVLAFPAAIGGSASRLIL